MNRPGNGELQAQLWRADRRVKRGDADHLAWPERQGGASLGGQLRELCGKCAGRVHQLLQRGLGQHAREQHHAAASAPVVTGDGPGRHQVRSPAHQHDPLRALARQRGRQLRQQRADRGFRREEPRTVASQRRDDPPVRRRHPGVIDPASRESAHAERVCLEARIASDREVERGRPLTEVQREQTDPLLLGDQVLTRNLGVLRDLLPLDLAEAGLHQRRNDHQQGQQRRQGQHTQQDQHLHPQRLAGTVRAGPPPAWPPSPDHARAPRRVRSPVAGVQARRFRHSARFRVGAFLQREPA